MNTHKMILIGFTVAILLLVVSTGLLIYAAISADPSLLTP